MLFRLRLRPRAQANAPFELMTCWGPRRFYIQTSRASAAIKVLSRGRLWKAWAIFRLEFGPPDTPDQGFRNPSGLEHVGRVRCSPALMGFDL